MSFESDFEDMFPFTVTIHPFSSEAADGTPTYGTSYTKKCMIEDDVKHWRFIDRSEFGPRRMLFLDDINLDLKDKIVFPTGFAPNESTVTYVFRASDEDGYHHTEAFV